MPEAVMKAVIALIIIYIGTFLVAIQGGSTASVQASEQDPSAKAASARAPIDPAKEADIRALMELIGVRDQIQDAVTTSAEQYREKLLAGVSKDEKEHSFVNAAISNYEKKFDADQVLNQLVTVYDKHYSGEEIKGLMQFFGSPLGQKAAAEAPKITREIQEATRAASQNAIRDALQEARQENPGIGQNIHLNNAAPRKFQQHRAQPQETAAQSTPPQN
jgi:hypothetical protein